MALLALVSAGFYSWEKPATVFNGQPLGVL